MKKGIISINIIVILTALNIIFLSLLSCSLKLNKSKIYSLKEKEDMAYISSYKNISKYYILEIFKKTIEEIEEGEDINKKLKENINYANVKSIHIKNNMDKEINLLKFIENYTAGDYKRYINMVFKTKQNKRIYVNICLKKIKLEQEEINDINKSDFIKVFENRKDDIIEKIIIEVSR